MQHSNFLHGTAERGYFGTFWSYPALWAVDVVRRGAARGAFDEIWRCRGRARVRGRARQSASIPGTCQLVKKTSINNSRCSWLSGSITR